MDYQAMKGRLARMILEKSFKYSEDPPFTLVSGKTSPYYFNCKTTTLEPEGMYLIGHLIFDLLRDTPITAAGGLTLGADPIASALALVSYQEGRPIKSFIVRKEAKGHGTRSAVEGNVAPGEEVAVIDDVITTGGSTITAIERIRQAGLVTDRAVVLVDREEGGRENILKYVSRVDALLTRSEIMALYRER